MWLFLGFLPSSVKSKIWLVNHHANSTAKWRLHGCRRQQRLCGSKETPLLEGQHVGFGIQSGLEKRGNGKVNTGSMWLGSKAWSIFRGPEEVGFRQTGSVQFSSVQSLSPVRLCNTMNHSTPGLPVHHQLPEFTQTHVYWIGDTIQPSHPLSSPSPPALNLSQHQGKKG